MDNGIRSGDSAVQGTTFSSGAEYEEMSSQRRLSGASFQTPLTSIADSEESQLYSQQPRPSTLMQLLSERDLLPNSTDTEDGLLYQIDPAAIRDKNQIKVRFGGFNFQVP